MSGRSGVSIARGKISIKMTMGATKVSGTDFLAMVSDRAENLGRGLEAQVMKVDNEIL